MKICPSKDLRALQRKILKPWTPESEGSWLPWIRKNVLGPHHTLFCIKYTLRKVLLWAAVCVQGWKVHAARLVWWQPGEELQKSECEFWVALGKNLSTLPSKHSSTTNCLQDCTAIVECLTHHCECFAGDVEECKDKSHFEDDVCVPAEGEMGKCVVVNYMMDV